MDCWGQRDRQQTCNSYSLHKQMKHALNFQQSGCWDGSLGKSKTQRVPIIHTHFVQPERMVRWQGKNVPCSCQHSAVWRALLPLRLPLHACPEPPKSRFVQRERICPTLPRMLQQPSQTSNPLPPPHVYCLGFGCWGIILQGTLMPHGHLLTHKS